MRERIEIRIIYTDGTIGYSAINATFEDARKYYEGNYFNVGTTFDEIKKCLRIELLTN